MGRGFSANVLPLSDTVFVKELAVVQLITELVGARRTGAYEDDQSRRCGSYVVNMDVSSIPVWRRTPLWEDVVAWCNQAVLTRTTNVVSVYRIEEDRTTTLGLRGDFPLHLIRTPETSDETRRSRMTNFIKTQLVTRLPVEVPSPYEESRRFLYLLETCNYKNARLKVVSAQAADLPTLLGLTRSVTTACMQGLFDLDANDYVTEAPQWTARNNKTLLR